MAAESCSGGSVEMPAFRQFEWLKTRETVAQPELLTSGKHDDQPADAIWHGLWKKVGG